MSRELRIAVIKDGVARGLSTTKIAAEIEGCNRNKIIGFSHRKNIMLVATPQSTARRAQPNTPNCYPKVRKMKAGNIPPTPKPVKAPRPARLPPVPTLVVALEFPDEHYRVHFEDVKSGQCRFPLWGDERKQPRENYLYCGKPVSPGSSFCPTCRTKTVGGYTDEDGKPIWTHRINEHAKGKKALRKPLA